MSEIFDRLCDQTVEQFMAMPEQPWSEVVDGQRTWYYSNVYDTTTDVLTSAGLDRTTLLDELLRSPEILIDTTTIGEDNRFINLQELVLEGVRGAVLKRVYDQPDVAEREESNFTTYEITVARDLEATDT